MLKVLEKAEIQIVSLDEVKTHLRLDSGVDERYLLHLVDAATDYIEQFLNRALLSQKLCYTVVRDARRGIEISIPRPNITHIHSVTGIRSGARYVIKRYQLKDSDVSPVLLCASDEEAIEIVYQAGYGIYPKHIPAPIKHALFQIVTDLYENRGSEGITRSEFYKELLRPYKAVGLL